MLKWLKWNVSYYDIFIRWKECQNIKRRRQRTDKAEQNGDGHYDGGNRRSLRACVHKCGEQERYREVDHLDEHKCEHCKADSCDEIHLVIRVQYTQSYGKDRDVIEQQNDYLRKVACENGAYSRYGRAEYQIQYREALPPRAVSPRSEAQTRAMGDP